MHTVVKSVLMRIKAFRKIGLTSGAIVQKFRTYLKNKSAEATEVIIGNFMRLVLIYNKNIIVAYVVYLSADKKAFTARKAEKDLTAIVYMYVRIWIALLGIIDSEACIIASVGYCAGAAFKNVIHNGTRFQIQEIWRVFSRTLYSRRLL